MILHKKLKNSILGFIVGDAYGVPYEFMNSSQIPNNPKFIGYGTHYQPEGTWSDDTSLLLATMDSINECKDVNIDDIKAKYKEWLFDVKYTADNIVFDIGNTTKQAIKSNIPGASIKDNGNGSLMRMLPVAIWTYFNKDGLEEIVRKFSSITHAHEVSTFTCLDFVKFYHDLIDGKAEKSNIDVDTFDVNGYVIGTFILSKYCFLRSRSYSDSIKMAIKFGGDTDTNAAITGCLTGFGSNKIPYVNKIVNIDFAEKIINKFLSNFVF